MALTDLGEADNNDRRFAPFRARMPRTHLHVYENARSALECGSLMLLSPLCGASLLVPRSRDVPCLRE